MAEFGLLLAALVASLAPVALARAVLSRRRDGDTTPSPRGAPVRFALELSALAVALAPIGLTRLVSPELAADTWERYETVLLRWSAARQATLGLVLLGAASFTTAWLVADRVVRPRARIAALGAVVAWALVYSRMRMHLSAMDFDDFYVVDKHLGSILPDWNNDKPFFTPEDLLYRIADVVAPTRARDEPLFRYRVNGWLFVLHTANVALVLRRVLGRVAVERLGRPLAAAACALGALPIGALVLSHSVLYELWAAVAVALSFNVIETLRESRHEYAPAAIVAWLGFGLLMATQSARANAFGWLAVLAHGVLALRSLRARAHLDATAMTVFAVLVIELVGRDLGRVLWSFDLLVVEPIRARNLLVGAGLPLLVALAVAIAWAVRRGRSLVGARRLIAAAVGTPARAAFTIYLSFGMALYLLPNQGNFGVPLPGWERIPWEFATNHARYSGFVYPFAAAAVGWVALRAPRFVGVRAVTLVAAAFGWNQAYFGGFYCTTAPGASGMTTYRGNSALYEAARATLRDAPNRLAYLPLAGYDHGDHFLARAVRPTVEVSSVCDAGVREDATRVAVITRYTLHVLHGQASIPRPLVKDEPNAGDVRGPVFLVPVRDLSSTGLDALCAGARRTRS